MKETLTEMIRRIVKEERSQTINEAMTLDSPYWTAAEKAMIKFILKMPVGNRISLGDLANKYHRTSDLGFKFVIEAAEKEGVIELRGRIDDRYAEIRKIK